MTTEALVLLSFLLERGYCYRPSCTPALLFVFTVPYKYMHILIAYQIGFEPTTSIIRN